MFNRQLQRVTLSVLFCSQCLTVSSLNQSLRGQSDDPSLTFTLCRSLASSPLRSLKSNPRRITHTHTKKLYTRGLSVSVGAGEGLLCSSSALIPVENLQQKSEREIWASSCESKILPDRATQMVHKQLRTPVSPLSEFAQLNRNYHNIIWRCLSPWWHWKCWIRGGGNSFIFSWTLTFLSGAAWFCEVANWLPFKHDVKKRFPLCLLMTESYLYKVNNAWCFTRQMRNVLYPKW